MALLSLGVILITAAQHLTPAHGAHPTSQKYAISLAALVHSRALKMMALLSLGVDCELAAIQVKAGVVALVQVDR